MTTEEVKLYLDIAQSYADMWSTCTKVAVGCVIVPSDGYLICGANRGVDFNCRVKGCQRVALYGENSKDHRLPSDCRAVHSEVDAITRASRHGVQTNGATAFVTRYPCEACARALVAAGISTVYYGRSQEISEQTQYIFASNGVRVVRVKSWNYDDTEV